MTEPAKTRLGALLLAVSATALSFAAGLFDKAHAQEAPSQPTGWEVSPEIVPRDGLSPVQPPPTGILDTGVIGIGQIITDAAPPGGGVGLCSGTLINPRTVIFAAHCVNTRPASAYGSATGTVGVSVGFNPSNLPAVQNWIVNGWRTNTALNIYNVNQVWYHPDSTALGPGLNFLQADIALATLDTPAFDIPQWTLLFSPLTEGTHATIVGYGATGSGGNTGANLGIDFRRRSAENMLDALISLNDVDEVLFGLPPGGILPQGLYMADFDDPLRADIHDFDFLDGDALPNESITAGGDSGGPLIVDEAFDIPVVAGVLSGGLRFFGAAQPFSSYGTASFYQPLFLYWDDIVQNNSYVYAESRKGVANWMDPTHWIQAMDPNYAVIREGALANDLPDTPALGTSTDATNFGSICFLDDCVDMRNVGPGENSTGDGLVLPGGPGSTDFVPNNVTPNPVAGVRARYYDVTLASIGHTYLQDTVTIDRFAIDGIVTSLDVRSAGVLNVLGDFNMWRGSVEVDGRVNSGEALLVQALLTGGGTFNPTFLTSVDGIIAPGDLIGVGTLTVQGDVILSSGNELLIELSRTTSDQLRVTADAAQGTTGILWLGGDLWLSPGLGGSGPPRHGSVYTIALADGGVQNTFDAVHGFLGVLRAEVTYNANSVTVALNAGKFVDFITSNPALMPFALALDELREDHYNALFNLYGEIDLMDPNRLSAAFSSMAPGSLMDAHGLLAMQGSAFGDTLQDRMAFLARSGGAPMGLTVMGNPAQILAFSGDDGLGNAGELSFASMVTENRTIAMPNGMSAFFSGGYDENRSSAEAGRAARGPDDGLRTWHMLGGVEHSFGDVTLGVAGGYSRGEAMQGATAAFAENDLAQTAAYGVYRFDDGVYLSGMVGHGSSRTATDRRFIAGSLDYQMQGDVTGQMFLASVEAGMSIDVFEGFMLTPHIALRQYAMVMEGFTEGGGGETALTIDEQRYGQLEARLGVRLNGAHRFNTGWSLVPSLDAAAVSALEAEDGGMLARFALASDVPFYLPGAGRDDFWGEVTGGLSLVRGETSFSLRMETSVAREELHEDRYMARFAHRF